MRAPRAVYGAALVIASSWACGESTAPDRGDLRASVTTTGLDADLDGYQLLLGDEVIGTIGIIGSLTIGNLPEGSHRLTLAGVANNCSVGAQNPRDVTISSTGPASIAFTVICEPTGIQATARTTGWPPVNGFQIIVDGHSSAAVKPNSSTVVSRLPPGTYSVRLVDTGATCRVSDPNPVVVQVENGKLTTVSFDVTCEVSNVLLAFVLFDESAGYPFERVVVADSTGSSDRILATGYSPAWAPDGSRLVFSDIECGYPCEGSLVIAEALSGRGNRLPNSWQGSDPAWSPNGEEIVYTLVGWMAGELSPTLHFITPEGISKGVIAMPVRWAARPSWSPDGSRIVFECHIDDSSTDICVVGRDGDGFRRLTRDSGWNRKPAWSPDGTTIAFAATRSSEPSTIALMASDGTNVRRVTAGSDPGWDRDGFNLIFAGLDGIFRVSPDGRDLTRLTTGRHSAPRWSRR